MVQRPLMYGDFGDGLWNWLYRLTLQGIDQIDEAPLVYLKLLRAFYLRFHKLSPLFAEAFPHLGTQKCSKVPPISPKAAESFQTWKLGFQGLGLSENRLNPYTQWFCWSLSLLNGYYFIGAIHHFQTYPFLTFDGTLAMRWRNVFESNQISEFFSPRNLLKFIGASVFAAGHALQCIHKGKAAAWLGKNGEKPKSRKAQPTHQWPKIPVEQLLHFFILYRGIRGLSMLFDFIEDCYDPFFGKWFWLRDGFLGWHEIFFCCAVVFRCSNPNSWHTQRAILDDHRSHVWRDSLW